MEATEAGAAGNGPEHPIMASLAGQQGAVVLAFCQLFGPALEIAPFSAEQLEQAVVQPREAGHQAFLGKLVNALLRPGAQQPQNEQEAQGWPDKLRQKLSRSWPLNFENDPLRDTDFFSITPQARVAVLFALCLGLVLESPLVQDVIWKMAEDVGTPPGAPLLEPTSNTSELLQRCAVRLGNAPTGQERLMYELLAGAVLPRLAASAARGGPADNKPGVVQAADHGVTNHVQEPHENQQQRSTDGSPAAAQPESDGGSEQVDDGQRGRKRSRSEALAEAGDGEQAPPAGGAAAGEGPASGGPGGGSPAGQEPPPSEAAVPKAEAEATPVSPDAAAPAEPQEPPPAGPQATDEREPEAPPAAAAAAAPQAGPAEVKAEQREASPAPAAAQPPPPPQPKLEVKPEQLQGPPVQPAEPQGQLPQGAAGQDHQAGESRPARRASAPRKFLDSGEFDDEEEEPAPAPAPAPRAQPGPPPGAFLPQQVPPQMLQQISQHMGQQMHSMAAAAMQPQLRPGGGFHAPWAQQGPQAVRQGMYQQQQAGAVGFPGARPPPPAVVAAPQHKVLQFKALHPSALDLPVPRRQRSAKRRQPRGSRASMNRLKQAAHGTLPLGVRKSKASVYLIAGGGEEEEEASASESELGEEEDEESSSEFSDSDLEDEGPRRGGSNKKGGRARPGGSGSGRPQQPHHQPQQQQQAQRGYEQQRVAYPPQVQAALAQLQQHAAMLQQQLATAPPHLRTPIMQQLMVLQQRAQQITEQANAAAVQQQQAASQQARGGGAGLPLITQLPPDQQQRLFQMFTSQLNPEQQAALRQLPQPQVLQLLQTWYQQKMQAGQGGAPQQQTPPQVAPQQVQQQQQFAAGGAAGAAAGGLEQAKLAALLNTMTPEQRAQLQQMPVEQQRTILAQIVQRQQQQQQQMQMVEQQRLMQQQQQQQAAAMAAVGPGRGMMGGGGMGTPPGAMGAAGPGGMPPPQGQQGAGAARGPQQGGNWPGMGGEGGDPMQFLNDS